MDPMQKQQGQVNIYDIKYPCYVAPVPPEGNRILHVPGEFEYGQLDNVAGWVIEAYKTKDMLYIFDAVPRSLWFKRICRIPYEKRLKYVRILVTSQIAAFDKVMDLSSVLIDNPAELTDYLDNLLTAGIKVARIMDVDGFYVFGECTNGEYMELDL